MINSNKKAVLSQGELHDATVNFDAYRILQQVNNRTFMSAKHGNLVDADVQSQHKTP